jgi:hypothetical protein
MQEKYRDDIFRIDRNVQRLVAAAMGLPRIRRLDFFKSLHCAGKDQADLVLTLLHLDHSMARKYVENLIGHKIKRCATVYCWRPIPLAPRNQQGDRQCLIKVKRDPRLKSGRRPWLRKWDLFKVGVPVEKLRRHGVTRKQLRLYEKRGWIKVGASAAVPRLPAPGAAGAPK